MALSLQQFIPGAYKTYLHEGVQTHTSNLNKRVRILAGITTNVGQRFVLPRSTSTGKGVKLNSIALVYRIVSGTLTSMTPSLTKYTYTDGAVEGSSAISITTPDPSFPAEAFVLTSTSTYNRARSAVDSPAYENSVGTESIHWNYNIAIVGGAADTEVYIAGFEITYNEDVSAGTVEDLSGGNPYSTSFTADLAKSGMTTLIDSSGGTVIVTLPNITAASLGTTLSFKAAVASANAIQISPDASDSVQGLNLNSGATVDKDYILATPVVGDFITIQAGVDTPGAWQITSAAGTWTREV